MLYGVPRGDTTLAGDYSTYFRWVFADLNGGENEPVYVGGGATDPSRPRETEAHAAYRILRLLGINIERLRVHPKGLDAREVLEHIARVLPTNITHVRISCAYTHQDLVRFLAQKIFVGRTVEVVPLPFPVHQGRIAGVLGRIIRAPRTLLGMAAWSNEPIRDFEWRLRLRHMRKCAAHPELLPPER